MDFFGSEKKPAALASSVTEGYRKASDQELKQSAERLRNEAASPSLDTGTQFTNLASGLLFSPESIIGNVVGGVAGYVGGKEYALRSFATEKEGSIKALRALASAKEGITSTAVRQGIENGFIKKGTQSLVIHQRMDFDKHAGIMLGSLILGIGLGLAGYLRYNKDSRSEITEAKNAELKFVEQLQAERNAAHSEHTKR